MHQQVTTRTVNDAAAYKWQYELAGSLTNAGGTYVYDGSQNQGWAATNNNRIFTWGTSQLEYTEWNTNANTGTLTITHSNGTVQTWTWVNASDHFTHSGLTVEPPQRLRTLCKGTLSYAAVF